MNINDCRTGMSYCGLNNKLYPDRRSMGYPFDRSFNTEVTSMQKFMTPNMFMTDVKIIHSDQLRQGRIAASTSISLRELDSNTVAQAIKNVNNSNNSSNNNLATSTS